jgi:hypothetical protein
MPLNELRARPPSESFRRSPACRSKHFGITTKLACCFHPWSTGIPDEELGRSHEKILGYIKSKGYKMRLPSQEIYLKGPGMLFKGNPKKYLTEIQIMIEK